MRSASDNTSKMPFPKLMINENVIALFTSPTEAVCVHEIAEDAIELGKSLGKNCFDVANFTDYNGFVKLSNT